MFRAHGHSHEHHTTDFLRIVQAVLQGDTGPQRVPDQHQVVVPVLGPQPAPYPFSIALNTRTGCASPVPGQSWRETAVKNSRAGSETLPHIPLHQGHEETLTGAYVSSAFCRITPTYHAR